MAERKEPRAAPHRAPKAAMKSALVVLTVAIHALAATNIVCAQGRLEIVATVSGASAYAIYAAMPEFLRRNLDPALYEIIVAEEGNSLSVLFKDPRLPSTIRGGLDDRPQFEVELDKSTYRVIRSNFVR